MFRRLLTNEPQKRLTVSRAYLFNIPKTDSVGSVL